MWGTQNGFVEFCKEDLGQYHALIARFLRHANWEVRFSDVFVGEKVRRILEIVQSSSEQEVSSRLEALISELDTFAEEQAVYIPIIGLDLTDRERWDLPGGIVLHKSSDSFLKRFGEEIFSLEYIRKNSAATVWAEYHAIADSDRALARAEQLLGRFIDIFRFWTACHTESSSPVAVSNRR
jgi:hypothetical protein